MTKEEIILLLKKHKETIAKRNCIILEIDKLKKTIDKMKSEPNIVSKLGTIHSNKISDSTGDIAVSNITKTQEQTDKIKELEQEKEPLEYKIDIVEIRLNSLGDKAKKIVTAYYIDEYTAEEIGNKIYYEEYCQTRSGQTIYDIISKSIDKMAKI